MLFSVIFCVLTGRASVSSRFSTSQFERAKVPHYERNSSNRWSDAKSRSHASSSHFSRRRGSLNCSGEIHASQKIVRARIGAQTVKHGIDLVKRHGTVSLVRSVVK